MILRASDVASNRSQTIKENEPMSENESAPQIPARLVASVANVRLTPDEVALLAHIGGGPDRWADGSPMAWGAAMSVMIEYLHGLRLITYPNVKLTDAGREALAALTD